MTDREQWAKIKGYENYSVSTYGKVRNDTTGRILKASKTGHGYRTLRLGSNSGKLLFVHRLVAEAFLEKPDGCTEVNHIDGDKDNNSLSNLEWCTSSENHVHAFRTGLNRSGENHERAKLSNTQVEEIKKEYAVENVSQYELASTYGVDQSTISCIVNNKRRRFR